MMTIESKLVRRVLEGTPSGGVRKGRRQGMEGEGEGVGVGGDAAQSHSRHVVPPHDLYEHSSCIVNIGGFVARLFDIRKRVSPAVATPTVGPGSSPEAFSLV